MSKDSFESYLSEGGLHSGDHLPKKVTADIVNKVADILQKTGGDVFYDKPGEDGQSLLAYRIPGSEVSQEKHKGIPSWERHPGD